MYITTRFIVKMKLITPEISWHQKEPIFSVDFCPQSWKLASCGADFTIKIWQVKEKEDGDDSVKIEFLANLDRHSKPVNVVRFSPNGKLLASGGDDGAIVLWKLNENSKMAGGDFDEDFGDDVVNKENWVMHKMLRGHIEDVYDLAWSPDSTQLITGSVDNTAIIWDAAKGQSQKILSDHKHYVQGVCWDPRGDYVVTHSSDRSCRIYTAVTHKCLHNIHRNNSSYMKDGQLTKSKLTRMFMDETMQSFFRRCTFTPDGSLLILPAGLCDGENKPRKTSYIFARGHYGRPVCHLPGTKKATVAVRCNPICFDLIDDKENQPNENQENNTHFKIPYRMVYAVVSLDAVTFYDTQHCMPIGHCANMHYASLTDATWSSDGRLLVVSSTDGYCSFVKFEESELGVPIAYDAIDYQVTQMNVRMAAKKDAKKKEQDAKKKEKDAAKKLMAAAVVIESKKEEAEETLKEVTPSTPVADDAKDKSNKGSASKPVLDKNQPTIEKLFVTPVRKRKRIVESPVSCESNSGAKNTKTDGEVSQSPTSNTDTCLLTNDMDKTPKRPHVMSSNLTTETSQDSTSKASSVALKKTPKRANVTTLQRDTTFSNSTIKTKEVDQKGTITNYIRGGDKTPSLKPFKRVTVTTLTTFNNPDEVQTIDEGEILRSPIEIRSPLPDIVLLESPKTPNRTLQQKIVATPTSIKSPLQSVKNIVHSPSSNKPPKRVQVTTLTTFEEPPTTLTSSLKTSDKKKEMESESSETPKALSVIVIDE